MSGKTDRLNGLPPDVRALVDAAIEEFVACVVQGFTGSLAYDFEGGVPMVFRKAVVHRYLRQGRKKPLS